MGLQQGVHDVKEGTHLAPVQCKYPLTVGLYPTMTPWHGEGEWNQWAASSLNL